MRPLICALMLVGMLIAAAPFTPVHASDAFSLSSSPLNSNERFVGQMYIDLLHRSVDAAGLNAYVPLANGVGGRQAAADALLTSSEYRAAVCQQLYLQYLNRSPVPSELASCVSLLGSITDEQMTAAVLASSEFFTNRTDATNTGFVNAVYADLLNRAVDSGATLFVSCLNSSSCTRTQVAQSILASAEYRGDLCASLYARFLHRTITSPESSSCTSYFGSGGTDEGMLTTILSSTEYENNDVPSSIPVLEGSFIGTVGSFTDADSSAVAGDYSSSIDWGDSTPATSGTVSAADSGMFYLDASHAYADEGSSTITALVTDVPGGISTSINTAAHIEDAPLLSQSVLFDPIQGTSFTGTVATFIDSNPQAVPGDFSAIIDWGDGTTSAATVSGTGPFALGGMHTYGSTGVFAVKVTITDDGGQSGAVTSLAEVQTPSAVIVSRFQARQSTRGTRLSWRAGSAEILGYRLWRRGSTGFTLVDRRLLTGHTFLDRSGHVGNMYRLAALGRHGQVMNSVETTVH